MTLNGVMAVILRYFSKFGYIPGVLRKSSRSLSHLLMSSCLFIPRRLTSSVLSMHFIRFDVVTSHSSNQLQIAGARFYWIMYRLGQGESAFWWITANLYDKIPTSVVQI